MDYYKQSKAKKQRQQLEEQVRLSQGRTGMFRSPSLLPSPNMQPAGVKTTAQVGFGDYSACLWSSSVPDRDHEHGVLSLSGGSLAGEALDAHPRFLQTQFLPFPNAEECPHVPAHGAVLSATGDHLQRQGSAVPPAGHPLGPVSAALPLPCSCSPSFLLGAGTGLQKGLNCCWQQGGISWHKAFAGFQVPGVCQHRQQQLRWEKGMARGLWMLLLQEG